MEAKRKALDEIAAHQRAAEEKRKLSVANQPAALGAEQVTTVQ
jgi:hypothetical protein